MSKQLKILLGKTEEYLIFRGKQKRKLSLFDFHTKVLKSEEFHPIFFLSTGRTGTKWFTSLLNQNDKVSAFHSLPQELVVQSKVVHDSYLEINHKSGGKDLNELLEKLTFQIFLSAREDLLYKSHLHDKQFVETNYRVTFFTPSIHKFIPGAVFVHVYRHPGEVIRSGLLRGWYSSTNKHEIGRLAPSKGSDESNDFKNYDQIQKIAWLWNATNTFAEKFLGTLSSDRYHRFNFNDLNVSSVKELLGFLNISVAEGTITKMLKNPQNAQKKEAVPPYSEWGKEDKAKVREICGGLANQYGYEL